MHKAVAGLAITLGVFGMIGTALWCVAGAGIYGSPLSGVRGFEGWAILILLVAGPLSLLPAGIVGLKRPVYAGVWLIIAAFFCFFWHLGVIMNDGFDQLFRSFEAWLPVALICAPMAILGAAFLWVGRARR